MFKTRLNNLYRNAIKRPRKGFTLVEVVVSILLLGLVTAAILSGLGTASIVVRHNDEVQTAKNVAESQLESVKNQLFVSGATTYAAAVIPNAPAGYIVAISAVDWTNAANSTYDTSATANRDNIQQITVTITKSGKQLYRLVGYKVE
jgi:prepilin-type N-terminal cleavage/methylation domain-containing protein